MLTVKSLLKKCIVAVLLYHAKWMLLSSWAALLLDWLLFVEWKLYYHYCTHNNLLFFSVDDELISPCMCKGTQQFVHRSCLDHWRSVKAYYLIPCAPIALLFICNFYNPPFYGIMLESLQNNRMNLMIFCWVIWYNH